MAISFPTGLDNFTNPSSGNTLDSPSHSLQHSDLNDAVEALERKVGVGTAVAGSASAGQVLTISAAGTSTWSTPTAAGLTQVIPTSVAVGSGSGSVDANGAVTFTSVSSISLNGSFTSTFDNYRIVVTLTATNDQEFRWRGRTGGTDNTNANYVYQIMEAFVTSLGASRTTGSTYGYAGYLDASRRSTYILEFFNPQATQPTGMFSSTLRGYDGNAPVVMFINNGFTPTTSFDGVTLYPGTGTMTGTLRVYGYKN